MRIKHFKNLKIMITGTSSGIGKALAFKCLEEGAFVYGISHEQTDAFNQYPNYFHKVFDLRQLDRLEDILNDGYKWLSGLDILVLNAGMATYNKILKTPINIQNDLNDLNIKSVTQSFKWLLKTKKEASFRCVVTSSVMADTPFPGYAYYSGTKAFISSYFKAARYELNKNQMIHLVYPVATQTGFFKTSGQTHASPMMQTPERVAEKMIKGIKKNKKTIHLSYLFLVLSNIFPLTLKGFMKKEIKRLNDNNEKK